MFGKYKFKKGQRVRPSEYSIGRFIFPKTRHNQSGVVTEVDKWNCPTVVWDRFKTPQHYHADFIAPDRRRKRPD